LVAAGDGDLCGGRDPRACARIRRPGSRRQRRPIRQRFHPHPLGL